MRSYSTIAKITAVFVYDITRGLAVNARKTKFHLKSFRGGKYISAINPGRALVGGQWGLDPP